MSQPFKQFCEDCKERDYYIEQLEQELKSPWNSAIEKCSEIVKDLSPKANSFHYLCYGGSTCTRIDFWGKEKNVNCKWRGDKNWMCPICENCDGILKGDFALTKYEQTEKYLVGKIAQAIMKEKK